MRAGDVVVVDFGVPAGSEAGFVRPAVVVTADAVLARSPRTVQVVPITTTQRGYAFEVEVSAGGLERNGVAQCQLLTTVSVVRIASDDLGDVGPATLRVIGEVLADLLDIG